MRVLIAEMQLVAQTLLQQMCVEQGITSRIIVSQTQLLELIQEQETNICIYDACLVSVEQAKFYDKIRQVERVPMIALIQREATFIREPGLHESIYKPFAMPLLMRVIKQLHEQQALREQMEITQTTIRYCDLSLNCEQYEAKYKQQRLALTAKEFLIFYLLAEQPNQVISREVIYTKIWENNDKNRDYHAVDYYLKGLRKKINHLDIRFQIDTIYRKGYKFTIFSDNS